MSTPNVCKNCIYLYQNECKHSHGPLVPNEVSCGGKVSGETGRKGTEMNAQERELDELLRMLHQFGFQGAATEVESLK